MKKKTKIFNYLKKRYPYADIKSITSIIFLCAFIIIYSSRNLEINPVPISERIFWLLVFIIVLAFAFWLMLAIENKIIGRYSKKKK